MHTNLKVTRITRFFLYKRRQFSVPKVSKKVKMSECNSDEELTEMLKTYKILHMLDKIKRKYSLYLGTYLGR